MSPGTDAPLGKTAEVSMKIENGRIATCTSSIKFAIYLSFSFPGYINPLLSIDLSYSFLGYIKALLAIDLFYIFWDILIHYPQLTYPLVRLLP